MIEINETKEMNETNKMKSVLYLKFKITPATVFMQEKVGSAIYYEVGC